MGVASKIFEAYLQSATINHILLVGYLKAGATMNVNGVDRSLSTTGAWTDLTALSAGAVGGVVEVTNADAAEYRKGGLRKNGSSENIYWDIKKHIWAFVECDAGRLLEGEIETVDVDFWEVGVFTAASGRLSRYHDLSGLGGQGQVTWDPLG